MNSTTNCTSNCSSVLYHEAGEKQEPAPAMPVEELARRLYEERAQIVRIGREKDVPYYILNIRHPAVRELYNALKARTGPWAPGDIERLSWELEVMGDGFRGWLSERYRRMDRAAAELRAMAGAAGPDEGGKQG